MEKIIKKVTADKEQEENLNFWKCKSDDEKLSAIQELRQQYIKFFNKQKEYDESRARLRRFYKVTKQT
ncbi:MAG: hypothetical protein Fur0015_10520 [Ignavibacteriales bacterium]